MKHSIEAIIQELRAATRTSLYNGNDIGYSIYQKNASVPTTYASDINISKRRRREDELIRKTRTWEMILSDATSMSPYMTDYDHGQVSRLASILLLGFLLPHSTGNEFFLRQNESSRKHLQNIHQTVGSSTSEVSVPSKDVIEQSVVDMSLEERLASVPFNYTNTFGELNSAVHEPLDAVFRSFLNEALAPFLSTRPAHARQVDLLHVLAMAIHPNPSEQPIRSTIKNGDGDVDWLMAQRLMSSLVPHSFQINYKHRLLLVRMVAESLVLPKYDSDQIAGDSPLFQGALPHLRAALYAFGMASMSQFDSHLAHCAMVNIAVQSNEKEVVEEEWARLLNRIMDDRTTPVISHLENDVEASLSFITENTKTFNPHQAKTNLMVRFLCRLCQARHYAKHSFLQHALASLSEAIEFKVDLWTKSDEGQSATNESPSILESLLIAARSLYYFLMPLTSNKESDDSLHRDVLISCSIQLLHHWSSEIVACASNLLSIAFAYGADEIVNDYAGPLFSSLKLAIDNQLKKEDIIESSPLSAVLVVAVRKSPAIGHSVLGLLFDVKSHSRNTTTINTLIATVANACPVAATRHMDAIEKSLSSPNISSKCTENLLAALLACRRAKFFSQGDSKVDRWAAIWKGPEKKMNGWKLYLQARYALITGNFSIAEAIFEELALRSFSEHHHTWLTALQKISRAELNLSLVGTKGIPQSSVNLNSAAMAISSLTQSGSNMSSNFDLQIELLNLRLDFLDVVAAIRQIANEMRLINSGPKKFTRSSLHLKSTVKLLNAMGSKYLSLYRRYGLFICQQSRTSIRTLQALCRFVSSATQSAFIDEIVDVDVSSFQKNAILALTLPHGDSTHSLSILMSRLDEQVLKDMSGSIDPKIRASALMHVLDGVFQVPTPFPRSFFCAKSLQTVKYQLRVDHSQPYENEDADEVNEGEIEISPGSIVTILATGKLDNTFVKQSRLPFFVILMWYDILFHSPGGKPDAYIKGNHQDTRHEYPNTKSSSSHSNLIEAESLSPAGHFFFKDDLENVFSEDGLYTITTRMGCRDVRGGEWEFPNAPMVNKRILLRVNKSTQ